MNPDAHEPVLDLGRALEFFDHDRLLLQQVAQTYAARAQDCYDELSRAIAARDPGAGQRILHRVLPTVRLVGSAQLVRQGEQLQSAWQAGVADYDGNGFLQYLRQFNQALSGALAPGSGRDNAIAEPRH